MRRGELASRSRRGRQYATCFACDLRALLRRMLPPSSGLKKPQLSNEVRMTTLTHYAGIALVVLLPTVVAAQDAASSRPNSPGAPSAAHELLAAFEGTWTIVGSQPGRTSSDSCSWLTGGRRHLVCRRVSESADRSSEQLIVYSFRRADSAYVATVFLPGGQLWEYAGRPEGGRWVLYLQRMRPENAAQRLRQVIRVAADTLHFTEEASVNGGPWTLTDPSEDYKYARSSVRLPGR
jgi:hypothetical protein